MAIWEPADRLVGVLSQAKPTGHLLNQRVEIKVYGKQPAASREDGAMQVLQSHSGVFDLLLSAAYRYVVHTRLSNDLGQTVPLQPIRVITDPLLKQQE
jgi:hypothetical protein